MDDSSDRFSLVLGGPFHHVLGRLRLLGGDGLPSVRGAIALALLAWLPPALISVAEYLAGRNSAALSYFIDYTAYIRFLVALPLIVLTERHAHNRLTPIVDHFTRSRLIADVAIARFHEVVRRADARSSSALLEGALLLIVLAIAVFGARLDVEIGGFDWDGRVVDGSPEYSLAGNWSHWVAKPLFQFLVLRWVWRFLVWGWLLFCISRLRLKLVSYHPDRSGGLGFLSVYPMVFSGLIFALSAVIAAQLVSEVLNEGMGRHMVWSLMASWLAFVLLVFVGPLAVFLKPLYMLRERAIFELGRVAGEHQMAFEEKWLSSGSGGRDLLGSADVSSAADLVPLAAAPYEMRTLPISWPMVFGLILTAGAPMLAVLATQMPLSELLTLITSVL